MTCTDTAIPSTLRPITLLDEPRAPASPPGESPPHRTAAPHRPDTAGRGGRRPIVGGIVRLRYELKTSRVRQIYRRDFSHLSHLLQALDQSRDFRGVQTDFVDRLEAAITTAMADARHRFAATTVRIQQQLAQHQLSGIPIHYALPLEVWAPISNPHAREYLETLADADDTFAGLERAWLLGLLDTSARRAEEDRLRKAVRGIGLTIRQAYSEMARFLRPGAVATDHQRDAAAATPSREG